MLKQLRNVKQNVKIIYNVTFGLLILKFVIFKMQMQLKIKRMKLDVLFVNEDQISVLKVNNHFYTKLQIRYQLDVSDRCIRFVIQGVL